MADASPFYLYEFLYRGRPPTSPLPPDYHVILAADAQDAFGNVQSSYSQALTPDQAKQMGFDITTVVSNINAATMATNDALRAQVTSLQAKLVDAGTQAEALVDAANAAKADLQSKIDTLQAQVDAAVAVKAASADAVPAAADD